MLLLSKRDLPKSQRSKRLWIRRLVMLVLVLVILLTVVSKILQLTSVGAAGTDWPTYLHDPERTGASSDTILSPGNAGQLTLNWKFKTGGIVETSPTIVGNTAYVGSWDGYEYALDATTGQQKWKTFLGQTTATCDPQLAGISSAAAVQNGVVYLGGGDSYWYALDATTGNVLWKVFTGDNTAGYYNWASPLIYNGFAYIGISSVGDCPLVHGQLLRVDLNTHQIVNTFDVVPPEQLGGGIWGSPALDPVSNTIYVVTGTRNDPSQTFAEAFLALDATALTLKSSWKVPASQEVVDSDFGTTTTLFNDAAGNPLVTAINKNGYAYTFNRNNLADGPLWTQQIAIGGPCPQCGDGSVSSGAFGNGTLFMAGGSAVISGQNYRGSVRAMDPATGNYRWQHGVPGIIFAGLAYSNGLIIDGAGNVLEVLDAKNGARLYSYTMGSLIYSAASVSNGQIFVGGTDGNVYAFGLPGTSSSTPTPDPNCPNNWSCHDIGSPTPAGSETISGSTWNIQAGGSGITGTSDQFRFVSQSVTGDEKISAQVLSQQGGGSTQAGLMARQNWDATSPYYAAFLTPNNGLVVQYRVASGGAITSAMQLTTASFPLYIEIQRVGDQFTTATSSDGVNYIQVPGSTVIILMPTTFFDGLAVSSDNNGSLDTATYTAVAVGSPSSLPSTPCPTQWNCTDIGTPVIAGGQSLSGGTWTIQGQGQDIWNQADQFHFVWQLMAGDGSASAHIISQTNTNSFAKAGVMLRQSAGPGSPYYFALVTPGNGVLVQYRTAQGANAVQLASITGTVPTYLMVARSGTTYTAYTSPDGVTWTPIAGSSVIMNVNGTILAGLAVASDNQFAESVVTFDTVTINSTPPVCPTSWNCADIGTPALVGSQALNGGTWTLQAGGNDIWNNADQFHFVWQTLNADGAVKAHILSQDNTSTWAKAGVMLRQSNDPGSAYYSAFVTPSNGINVQYRTAQGVNAVQLAGITGTVPTYLMVARSGTTYTAYTSPDGVTWTPIVGSSVTMNVSGTILAGLAVTSHNGGALGTTTFDTVSVSTTIP